jgi:hypothetical protein
MRYLLLLVAVVLLVATCEDEGSRRMRELRELTNKQSNHIIQADGRFVKYIINKAVNMCLNLHDHTILSYTSPHRIVNCASTLINDQGTSIRSMNS